MVETTSKFWCNHCKDVQEVFQDTINDGHGAECLMRCSKCKCSGFEANSYFKDQLAKETKSRRSWWFAKEKQAEAKADLQEYEAANDFKNAYKARAAVAKYTAKMAECEKGLR